MIIILGNAGSYTIEQIILLSEIESRIKYIEDYGLYKIITEKSIKPCDMAYKEENREIYLNNIGQEILTKEVIVPNNYKITNELKRNYNVERLEGGYYG